MTFNTYNFVLYFLPISLLGYYILGKLFKPAVAYMWLLAFSVLFCLSFGVDGTLVLLADVAVNYLLSKKVENSKKKGLLLVAVMANVLALLLLKYLGFFASIGEMLVNHDIQIAKLIAPVGFSYITIRQISYMVDIYREELKVPSFLDFANYSLFFPMMVQGPLTPATFFLPQLKKENIAFDTDRFAKGLYWFAMGLAKKMLLADNLSKTVAWYYSNFEKASSSEAILTAIVYCFQLYFDFSGYCDMAAGISEMFGFSLPKNFDSPYKSTSIGEIWRRWHSTLMQFLQKYVYFSLGGSRKGAVCTCLNIMVVFILSGLWHGADWTYLVWGAIGGLCLSIERLLKRPIEKIPKILRWIFVQLYWWAIFIFFRASSLKNALETYRKIFSDYKIKVSPDFLMSPVSFEMEYLESHLGDFGYYLSLCNLPIFILISAFIIYFCKNLYEKEFKPSAVKALWAAMLLFTCIVSMGGITTFLYAIY